MDKFDWNKGFTLLEIIATLVILSILAAIAVPKYVSVDESARQRAIDAGIAELNGRETLGWSNEKISVSGWISDEKTYGLIDKSLGTGYRWDPTAPDPSGGTLIFKDSSSVALNRTESTTEQPGSWSR